MNTQTESPSDVEALELADELEVRGFLDTTATQAAAELRRLHEVEKQRYELLVALNRIAVAARTTAPNVAWIARHARAAIARAEGTYKAIGETK